MSELTATQQQEVIAVTKEWIDKANSLWKLKLEPLEIRFDLGGATWGHYVRRGDHRYLRYNPIIFALNYTASLAETIPHEVAHYVVDMTNPTRRVKPHGVEWKKVMHSFGFEKPSVTHKLDLSAVPRRRQQRFTYRCNCGTLELSATRHYRIQRNGMHYRCRKCDSEITAVTE